VERERTAEAATGFNLKLQQLQERLQQEQRTHSTELLQQRQQHEQQKHGLQRLLAEAEEQLERQRRELSAGFLLQAQQLEAKHAAVAADARAEAATAAALAEARGAEAAAAHEQLEQQLKRAEVRAGLTGNCDGVKPGSRRISGFKAAYVQTPGLSCRLQVFAIQVCLYVLCWACRLHSCKRARLKLLSKLHGPRLT
jgi:hypothetical protein